MRLTSLFTLFIFISAFSSCKKERAPNLSLPPVTQTGQNTLGFMLDNKVWANYGRRCTTMGGCHDNKVNAQLYKQFNGNFEFSLSAGYTVTSDTIDQSFGLHAQNITTAGTFVLDSSLGRGMSFIQNHSGASFKYYKNTGPSICTLTISRFDTTAKIVAGTFSAVLYNPFDLNDSVSIRDGRFDAQLTYYK